MRLLGKLVLLLGATISVAGASMLQYDTTGSFFTIAANGAGFTTTGTGTGSITITSGAVSDTLLFLPQTSTVNTPSTMSYGMIRNTYSGAANTFISFPSFTFTIVVKNVTSNTTASFLGSIAAGSIGRSASAPVADSSTLVVNWVPLALADGGTVFTINNQTNIVPDSTFSGQSTVQGAVPSSVPEPGSLFLLGAGLVGLGFSARKKFTGRS